MNETVLDYDEELDLGFENNQKVEYEVPEVVGAIDDIADDLKKDHDGDRVQHDELNKAKDDYDFGDNNSTRSEQTQELSNGLMNLYKYDISNKIDYNPSLTEKVKHFLFSPFGYDYKTVSKDEALKLVLEEKISNLESVVKDNESVVKSAQEDKKKQKELYVKADNKAGKVIDEYFSLDEKIDEYNDQIESFKQTIDKAKKDRIKFPDQKDTLDALIKSSYTNIKKISKLVEEKESFQEDYLDQFSDYKTDADIAKQNLKESRQSYQTNKFDLNVAKKSLNSLRKIYKIYGNSDNFVGVKTITTNEKLLNEAKDATSQYEILMGKRLNNLPIGGGKLEKSPYEMVLDQKDKEIKNSVREEMIKYRDRKY